MERFKEISESQRGFKNKEYKRDFGHIAEELGMKYFKSLGFITEKGINYEDKVKKGDFFVEHPDLGVFAIQWTTTSNLEKKKNLPLFIKKEKRPGAIINTDLNAKLILIATDGSSMGKAYQRMQENHNLSIQEVMDPELKKDIYVQFDAGVKRK